MTPHMVAEQLSAAGVNMENAWQKSHLEQSDRLVPALPGRISRCSRSSPCPRAAAGSAGRSRGSRLGRRPARGTGLRG